MNRYKDTREKISPFNTQFCFFLSLRTNTKTKHSQRLLHCGCTLCVSHLSRQLGPTHSRGLHGDVQHSALWGSSPVVGLPHAKHKTGQVEIDTARFHAHKKSSWENKKNMVTRYSITYVCIYFILQYSYSRAHTQHRWIVMRPRRQLLSPQRQLASPPFSYPQYWEISSSETL